MERLVVEIDSDELAAIAAKIPRAESVAPGTRVVVRPRPRGWIGKVLGAKGHAPLAAMGSALLARGYVAIAAGEDDGAPAAWGDAPA